MTSQRKTSASTKRKPARLYLLYGNKEAELNEAKLGILREFIPDDEERRENVVEILPPGTQPLTLKSAFPQIAAELGQESLFGDSCRAVVVHQLNELFGGAGGRGRRTAGARKSAGKSTSKKSAKSGKGGASEEEMLQSFLDGLRGLLEATSNAILFVAIEDDAKFRRVNDKSPLFAGLASIGHVSQFAAKSYRFELTDAIVERSLPRAMQIVTTWRREDRRAAIPIFRGLLDDVHLLIQAAIQKREGARLAAEPDYAQLLFPPDLKPNLKTIHSFRQGKYLNGIHNYPSVPDLLEGLRGLLDIQKALYPTGDELYVPDVDYLIDVWLAKFLGR